MPNSNVIRLQIFAVLRPSQAQETDSKRILEHRKCPTSSVFQHLTACRNLVNTQWKVTIIARDNDTINLRLKEAILIRELFPAINNREELCDLQRFIRTIY